MKRKKYFRLFKLNNIFNSQFATLLKQLLCKEHFAGKFLKIFKTAFLQDSANVCFWIVLVVAFDVILFLTIEHFFSWYPFNVWKF